MLVLEIRNDKPRDSVHLDSKNQEGAALVATSDLLGPGFQLFPLALALNLTLDAAITGLWSIYIDGLASKPTASNAMG